MKDLEWVSTQQHMAIDGPYRESQRLGAIQNRIELSHARQWHFPKDSSGWPQVVLYSFQCFVASSRSVQERVIVRRPRRGPWYLHPECRYNVLLMVLTGIDLQACVARTYTQVLFQDCLTKGRRLHGHNVFGAQALL